jgi:phosphomannomutase
VRYAAGFATYCGEGTIVLGRDGRITGKHLTHIISSTLISMGADVVALGVCPTPTIQIAVERLKAVGGIAVTASHNPMEWNGMKFLAPTGMFLDGPQNNEFRRLVEGSNPAFASWDHLGTFTADESWIDRHIKAALAIRYVNLPLVRRQRFKVVVDCVNASGSVIVPRLLRAFGCRVVEMNCDQSGVFAREPEPLPGNLGALSRRVKREKADLGIAVDPDADRLVLIDERGQPIGEEYTIANVVRFVLQKEHLKKKRTNPPPVVINLSTTRAVEDIASEFGVEVIRTPVGEINVAKAMQRTAAIVGGEGSGGVILSQVHLGRDSLVGMALTLAHLAEFGGPMSELRKSLPGYTIVKSKIDAGQTNVRDILDRLGDRYAGKGTVNTDDGLRIDFGDAWVQLRPSNTEPIIRIIAEARAEEHARELAAVMTREALHGS